MVDMWMLSVAVTLIDHVAESDPPALAQLEQAVRAVPVLEVALDAARSGDAADRRELAEALANALDVAYDENDEFADQLDALWPEVLFAPKRPRVSNFVQGNVAGLTVLANDIVGGISFSTQPDRTSSEAPDPKPSEAPDPTRPTFGFGRRTR